MRCAKCQQPLLSQSRLCWACGEEAPRAGARTSVEVREVDPGRVDQVVEVLHALVDAPRSAVAFVVSEPPFGISSTSPAHLERAGQWLSALGVRFKAQEPGLSGPAWRLHVRLDRGPVAKLGVCAALGLAAFWWEIPAVAWMAVAVAAFTLLRALEPRPTALELDPLKSNDRLEPLDSVQTAELIRSRRALTDAQAVAAMGRFLGEYVAVVGLLRARGEHLAGEGKASDERLQEVLRQALRMAAEAQRCASAEVSAQALAPERAPKLQKLRTDVLRHVDQLSAGLARARAQTLDLPPGKLVPALGPSIAALTALVSRLRAEAQSW